MWLSTNVAKYQQCNGSPFLQPPLLELFGYINSPCSEEVLNGTFTCPPNTPLYAELLLHLMRHPARHPSNPTPTTFVSTDDYTSSWAKAKEYTTSGISGIHFGMHKAQALDRDLTTFFASHWSIPYSSGSYYDQWLKGVDVMLLKASSNTQSDKLRTTNWDGF